MSALDNVKAFVDANPGSTWWLEELLFRGESHTNHGGRLKGAHVRLGMRFTGPDGNEHVSIAGPFPVGDLPNGIPVKDVLDELHLTQQNTIDSHVNTIAEIKQVMDNERKAHSGELDDLRRDHDQDRLNLMNEHNRHLNDLREQLAQLAPAKLRRSPKKQGE